MTRILSLCAVLCVVALTSCKSLNDAEKTQMQDSVAVAERWEREVAARLTDGQIVFDDLMRPTDLVRYLELNRRAWVTWAVKFGAVPVDSTIPE